MRVKHIALLLAILMILLFAIPFLVQSTCRTTIRSTPTSLPGFPTTAPLTGPAIDSGPGIEIHTKHYDIHVEGEDGEEIGLLLEALHGQLKDIFNTEPNERLRVKILGDDERYSKMIVEDGFDKPDKSQMVGVYMPENHTAYVNRRWSFCNTRQVFLHECTHQFHYLVRHHEDDQPLSRYYVEGLAEHFSTCAWDGPRCVIGDLPPIESRNLVKGAIHDFTQRHHGSFKKLATDLTNPGVEHNDDDYDGPWGLVSFLIDRHRALYLNWSIALDQMKDPGAVWDTVFGDNLDDPLSDEYLRWLKDHHQTWNVVEEASEWGQRDRRTIEGSSPPGNGYALVDGPAVLLTGSIESLQNTAGAGVLFGYRSLDEFGELLVMQSGEVKVAMRDVRNKSWEVQLVGSVKDPLHFTFSVKREGKLTKILLNGTKVWEVELPQDTKMGLAVLGGSARFRDVEVQE